MGRSFPRTATTGVIDVITLDIGGQSVMAYAVDGSPALTVSHALLELADRKPALCVSGINYGENVGTSLTASGTIGAAFEAYTYGVPALAVSLESDVSTIHHEEYALRDWVAAQYFTRLFAEVVLGQGIPEEVAILNLNVPHGATSETQIRQTRQSRQDYVEFIQPESRDLAKPFQLQPRIIVDDSTLEPDSDIAAIYRDKVVSITPLSWSMTANYEIKLP